jgi:hypothetical protein
LQEQEIVGYKRAVIVLGILYVIGSVLEITSKLTGKKKPPVEGG